MAEASPDVPSRLARPMHPEISMARGNNGSGNDPLRRSPHRSRVARHHPYRTTLLSLVQRVIRHAGSDREVVKLVRRLVNHGRVELIGSFKGERFE